MLTILLAATLAGGCGSGPAPAPRALLSAARRVVDATPAVHFQLTSRNLPVTAADLEGGRGDLARPGQLRGTFQASVDGLLANIKVVEVGGKFYAELPFTTGYQLTDPARFGFGDPASLLNPRTGVSNLLTGLSRPRSAGQRRLNGELLDEVTGTVPGSSVSGFLPDVDPAKPVSLEFGIDPSSHQVRTVEATGPFAEAAVASTYVVTLTDYGERVKITAPPA